MSNGMENLKPIQSVEQAREMGSKGGKASGRARREKKTMKQMLDYLLEKKIATKDGKKALASCVGRTLIAEISIRQLTDWYFSHKVLMEKEDKKGKQT